MRGSPYSGKQDREAGVHKATLRDIHRSSNKYQPMTSVTYTTQIIDKVTLVFADQGIPMHAYAALMREQPKAAVMDIGLAGRVGARLAMGLPEDLKAYRLTKPTICQKVQCEIFMAQGMRLEPELEHQIKEYLSGYDRGSSSDAMLQAATGIQCAANPDAYPHDGDDLGRCGKLYDSCAVVRTNIDKVALLGLKWAAIAHGLKEGVNRASLV
jgi:hypothetical protein